MEDPKDWLDFLHNELRSLEGMINECQIIMEEIGNTQVLEESGFVQEKLNLSKIVSKDLEKFIMDSGGDSTEETLTCVYEWKKGWKICQWKEG